MLAIVRYIGLMEGFRLKSAMPCLCSEDIDDAFMAGLITGSDEVGFTITLLGIEVFNKLS